MNKFTNKYGLDPEILYSIRKRDKKCVYCRKKFFNPSKAVQRKNWATIEHMHRVGPPWNDHKWVTFCCYSCNCSRGAKLLRDWFSGAYCTERNISETTVDLVVKEYLKTPDSYI